MKLELLQQRDCEREEPTLAALCDFSGPANSFDFPFATVTSGYTTTASVESTDSSYRDCKSEDETLSHISHCTMEDYGDDGAAEYGDGEYVALKAWFPAGNIQF